MAKTAPYTCNDYRQEMILLGMKQRLSQDTQLSEDEKRALEQEIHRLEVALKMK